MSLTRLRNVLVVTMCFRRFEERHDVFHCCFFIFLTSPLSLLLSIQKHCRGLRRRNSSMCSNDSLTSRDADGSLSALCCLSERLIPLWRTNTGVKMRVHRLRSNCLFNEDEERSKHNENGERRNPCKGTLIRIPW